MARLAPGDPQVEPNLQLDPEEELGLLLRDLGTTREGLSRREAERRLAQHGPNEIARREQRSRLRDLAAQFTHPLALLLWVASLLAVVGGIVPLAIAIVAVIVVNALFAFAQELQAERATEALQAFLPPHARVRHGGAELDIDASRLVRGDVLLIGEGDRLSADARLVDETVELDMSPLTGESQPVARSASRSRATSSPLEADAACAVCAAACGVVPGPLDALSRRGRR